MAIKYKRENYEIKTLKCNYEILLGEIFLRVVY